MKFVVEGHVVSKGQRRVFTKEIEAPSEKLAKERTYTFFGANQGAARNHVHIGKVAKL
ncbi:50S ribosomal protein L18a [Candidatus Micrarchaeota archaeon]|nr:50S ribosomal protein L18a [Candidatus Micrarchaeota archaeon]